MKKYDPLWNDINILLSCLRSDCFDVVKHVDEYYLKYNNEAPGKLLTSQINKLQEYLDNAND